MSRSLIVLSLVVVMATMMLPTLLDAKHIYVRYKRDVEREGEPLVPSKESTVVATGDDSEAVHKSVKDFSNEIANNERGGKDFFEFDYNPNRDLFQFSGRVPQMFKSPHMQMFEEMMQHMLARAQQMFQTFPTMTTFNNYPDNYNGTVESEIIIGGRRFRKKERILNKATNDTQLNIITTIYEPIDDEVGVTTVEPNKDGVTEGPIISY